MTETTETYELPTTWQPVPAGGPVSTADVVYPSAESITLSLADAELLEQLAAAGLQHVAWQVDEHEYARHLAALRRLQTMLAERGG